MKCALLEAVAAFFLAERLQCSICLHNAVHISAHLPVPSSRKSARQLKLNVELFRAALEFGPFGSGGETI